MFLIKYIVLVLVGIFWCWFWSRRDKKFIQHAVSRYEKHVNNQVPTDDIIANTSLHGYEMLIGLDQKPNSQIQSVANEKNQFHTKNKLLVINKDSLDVVLFWHNQTIRTISIPYSQLQEYSVTQDESSVLRIDFQFKGGLISFIKTPYTSGTVERLNRYMKAHNIKKINNSNKKEAKQFRDHSSHEIERARKIYNIN